MNIFVLQMIAFTDMVISAMLVFAFLIWYEFRVIPVIRGNKRQRRIFVGFLSTVLVSGIALFVMGMGMALYTFL